ncbi:MAG: hypothetical protein Tsb0020_49760 [Haliangiales bacterium]
MNRLSLIPAGALALILTLGATLGPGCESRSHDSGAKSTAAEPGAARAIAPDTDGDQPTALDPRSQYDLAAAIAETEKMRRDDAALALEKLQRDWHGKRYRWTVDVIDGLCKRTDRCNVLPFDTGRGDRHIVQGWMPSLSLTDDTLAAIHDRCEGQKRCTIQFEATLTHLNLSTETFTSLGFDDVEIL